MPLPDERPRQSVANLIGRFEQQNKRQSFSAVSPRSSSVASHSTGDSTREEAKEKREWPPKSTVLNDKPPPPIIPSWTKSAPPSFQSASPSANSVKATLLPADSEKETVSTSASTPVVSSPTVMKAASPPERQMSVSGSTKSSAAAAPSTPTSRAKNSPATSPVPTSSRTSVKSPAKSLSKASLSTSVSQPLKPQHTGQSTTSASTVRKPSRTAPTTPGRPKTPTQAGTNPKPSRPKTPSSSGRSKTPSGLFAPTAASLARARSAQPQVPTLTKKATLSSTVADRLSKPTAASMSRARSPVTSAVNSEKGSTKTPTTRVNTTKGPPKSKIPPHTSGMVSRERQEQKVADSSRVKRKADAAAVHDAGASPVAAAPIVNEEKISVEGEGPLREENGHALEESMLEEGASHAEYEEELTQEPEVVDQGPDTSGVNEEVSASGSANEAGVDAATLVAPNGADLQPEKTDQEVGPNPQTLHDDASSNPSVTTDGSQLEQGMGEVKSRTYVGNDIEEMVNLLESVPTAKARPLSIVSIPDEVHEIPDEF